MIQFCEVCRLDGFDRVRYVCTGALVCMICALVRRLPTTVEGGWTISGNTGLPLPGLRHVADYDSCSCTSHLSLDHQICWLGKDAENKPRRVSFACQGLVAGSRNEK